MAVMKTARTRNISLPGLTNLSGTLHRPHVKPAQNKCGPFRSPGLWLSGWVGLVLVRFGRFIVPGKAVKHGQEGDNDYECEHCWSFQLCFREVASILVKSCSRLQPPPRALINWIVVISRCPAS